MMTTDRNLLLQLISEGEHQQQDFKYKVMDAEKLARSVSAFANTDGGRLLIGVRDDGHISGVRQEEEIFMMHAAAFKYCVPASAIRFETFQAAGRTVVIATIPPAKRRPVCVVKGVKKRKRAYIRIADENILASPVHLEIWRQEQQPRGISFEYSNDDRTLIKALEELSADSSGVPLNPLISRTRIHRRKAITILARLIRYDLAQIRYSEPQFLFSSK